MDLEPMLPDFSGPLFAVTRLARFTSGCAAGQNFVHDVQFLSSYLHDARFTPEAVTRRGKKLSDRA